MGEIVRNCTPPKNGGAHQVWKKPFLEHLRRTGNITASAEAAGVFRSTAHNAKATDQSFSDAWDDALEEAADRLEEEARRRAAEGYLEPVFHQGAQCGVKRKYSDTLLIFLLKGAKKEKYAERQEVDLKAEVSRKASEMTDDELIAIASRGRRGASETPGS